jgi:hypothetical protein
MIALPLCILALAAGVYLLIKVNREYLGGIFKFFAWLIILLSLVATCMVARHSLHHNFGRMHHMHGHCDMPGMHGSCSMDGGAMGSCCKMGADSTCPMAGCKMVGDSVILDRSVCEKLMGKEACEKMCQGKDKCTISKEECAKMCKGMSNCSSAQGSCCKEGNMSCCKEGDKACCKGEEKEMKSCCKKK